FDNWNHHQPVLRQLASCSAVDGTTELVKGLCTLLIAGSLCAETSRLSEAVRKAGDYSRQGLNQEAEKAVAEALSIADNIQVSEDDFEVAASLNNLASLIYARGELDRAAQLFERCRQAYESLAGPDDTRLATVLYNLAGVHVEQGRYVQAEALYRRALESRENAFGAEHPLVAAVRNGVGFLYLQHEKYREARPLLEKALRIWENSTGYEAYTAVALNNLALVWRLQGSLDQAETLYKRAMAVEEKAFGAEHPELATTRMSLAALYRAWGKEAQAIEIYRQALTLLEKTVGPQDPLAVEIREKLKRK